MNIERICPKPTMQFWTKVDAMNTNWNPGTQIQQISAPQNQNDDASMYLIFFSALTRT